MSKVSDFTQIVPVFVPSQNYWVVRCGWLHGGVVIAVPSTLARTQYEVPSCGEKENESLVLFSWDEHIKEDLEDAVCIMKSATHFTCITPQDKETGGMDTVSGSRPGTHLGEPLSRPWLTRCSIPARSKEYRPGAMLNHLGLYLFASNMSLRMIFNPHT